MVRKNCLKINDCNENSNIFILQFAEVKVEVPVPKPYEVIKKVPYEVKEYVDKVGVSKIKMLSKWDFYLI